MPLFPSSLNAKDITDIIESDTFRQYHSKFRVELEIDDIEYNIEIQDYARTNEDPFGDQNTKATTIPSKDWSKAEKIVFFAESIANLVNDMFSKFNMDVFYKISEICVLYFLAHELVHVKQFKGGIISLEKKDEILAVQYNLRPIEVEANSIASDLVSKLGMFEQEVINMQQSFQQLDNDTVSSISRIYHKFYGS